MGHSGAHGSVCGSKLVAEVGGALGGALLENDGDNVVDLVGSPVGVELQVGGLVEFSVDSLLAGGPDLVGGDNVDNVGGGVGSPLFEGLLRVDEDDVAVLADSVLVLRLVEDLDVLGHCSCDLCAWCGLWLVDASPNRRGSAGLYIIERGQQTRGVLMSCPLKVALFVCVGELGKSVEQVL